MYSVVYAYLGLIENKDEIIITLSSDELGALLVGNILIKRHFVTRSSK